MENNLPFLLLLFVSVVIMLTFIPTVTAAKAAKATSILFSTRMMSSQPNTRIIYYNNIIKRYCKSYTKKYITSTTNSAAAFTSWRHHHHHNNVRFHTYDKQCIQSLPSSSSSSSMRLLRCFSTNDNGNMNDNEFIHNHNHNDYNNDDDDYNKEEKMIITQKTHQWIQNVIIGLNLCPFADKPMKQSKLFTIVMKGNDIEDIISNILYQCILRKDDEGTTIVVCPDLYPEDFEKYLDVVDMMDNVLDDYNLKDYIQIAPFHPLFEFQGAGVDAIDNFTNRSPYPIFHILREEEVSAAVKKLDGDSTKVYQRNINLLNAMELNLGRDDTEKVMRGEKVDGLQDLLKTYKDL